MRLSNQQTIDSFTFTNPIPNGSYSQYVTDEEVSEYHDQIRSSFKDSTPTSIGIYYARVLSIIDPALVPAEIFEPQVRSLMLRYLQRLRESPDRFIEMAADLRVVYGCSLAELGITEVKAADLVTFVQIELKEANLFELRQQMDRVELAFALQVLLPEINVGRLADAIFVDNLCENIRNSATFKSSSLHDLGNIRLLWPERFATFDLTEMGLMSIENIIADVAKVRSHKFADIVYAFRVVHAPKLIATESGLDFGEEQKLNNPELPELIQLF